MKKQYKKWKAGKTALIVSFLFLCMQVSLGQAPTVTEFNINDGPVTIDAPGDYLITGDGTQTTNTITVNVTTSNETTPVNITIKDVNIKASGSPFSITGYVKLTVEGVNNFEGGSEAGIRVPVGGRDSFNALVITEGSTGSLTAVGGSLSAGIGGNESETASAITINAGMITATGKGNAAGIGGGSSDYGPGGGAVSITINGGIVTATGGTDSSEGSGIGGGYAGDIGTITINGEIVTATATNNGYGIGGNRNATIIISGGTVTATGGKEGIGCDSNSTFSTGENGHAFIITNSIIDETKKTDWSGAIIIGGSGEVYGSPTLDTDAVIPDGKTLTVASGKTLKFAEGTTLAILENGTLNNSGTVEGEILNIEDKGTINGVDLTQTGYEVTYISNYGITNLSVIGYVASGGAPDNVAILRTYYSVEEWQDNSTGGNKVETISSTTTLYAQWMPNTFTLTTPEDYVIIHGEDINYDLSQLLPADMDAKTGGATNYAFKNNSVPDGWSISGSTVSCTQPDVTDSNGKEITFTITAKNTTTADVTVKFVVKPEYDITVTQTTGGTISADKAKTTEGETVTLSYTLEENYGFAGWTVTRTDNNSTVTVNGNTFAMPASEVTVSATFKETPPTPPVVEPDPEPSPTVYYTVTLPAVEEATTNPIAGDYDVEAWGSFRFYLILAEGYEQSKPVVTTSRGEQIEPRSSDGAYIIKYVHSDVDIRIDGIVKNPDPVANETIGTDGIKVRAANGYLHIQTPQPELIYIFTPDGRLLKTIRTTNSEERIALPKGIYLIRIAGRCVKVVL